MGRSSNRLQRFLSTLSLRRATRSIRQGTASRIFLSTLSLRRATDFSSLPIGLCHISIHALLAESDRLNQIPPRRFHYHFYPRSPCGERPVQNPQIDKHDNFYPRSPCGERLLSGNKARLVMVFLSTLSLRRATPGEC